MSPHAAETLATAARVSWFVLLAVMSITASALRTRAQADQQLRSRDRSRDRSSLDRSPESSILVTSPRRPASFAGELELATRSAEPARGLAPKMELGD